MRDIRFNFLFLLFTILFCNCYKTNASEPDSTTFRKIDEYVQKQMKEYKIPGAALGIVQGNRVIYIKGYGIADNNGRKVTPQTPFHLASVTKSFTALCIMQLFEKGKINLDTPVKDYLPWFRVADSAASSKITIRNLLNQTSGFSEGDGIKEAINDDTSLIAFIQRMKNTPLLFPPGQKWSYSNINYIILGLIIQKVSGQSYDSYVQKNIFDPLDMQHSYISYAEALRNNISDGHYSFFGIPIVYNKMFTQAAASAGGIYSNAEDMTHYLIAHLNRGRYRDTTILSEKGIAELHKPVIRAGKVGNYAMGWLVSDYYDIIDPAVFHEGEGAGFHAIAILAPEKHFGLIWLVNLQNHPINSVFNSMGFDIAEIFMGIKPPPVPRIYEDFAMRNIRIINAIIIFLLLISVFWSILSLRRWQKQKNRDTYRPRRLWINIIIPGVIDLLLIVWLLVILQVNLTIGLYFIPDVAFEVIFILALTIGWGTVRTLLMLRILFRKSKIAKSST